MGFEPWSKFCVRWEFDGANEGLVNYILHVLRCVNFPPAIFILVDGTRRSPGGQQLADWNAHGVQTLKYTEPVSRMQSSVSTAILKMIRRSDIQCIMSPRTSVTCSYLPASATSGAAAFITTCSQCLLSAVTPFKCGITVIKSTTDERIHKCSPSIERQEMA